MDGVAAANRLHGGDCEEMTRSAVVPENPLWASDQDEVGVTVVVELDQSSGGEGVGVGGARCWTGSGLSCEFDLGPAGPLVGHMLPGRTRWRLRPSLTGSPFFRSGGSGLSFGVLGHLPGLR